MRLTWDRSERAILWTRARTADGGRIRLVVEALPGGMWDWTAWHAIDRTQWRYGITDTEESAIAAAEAAARDMAQASGTAVMVRDADEAVASLNGGA